MCLLLCFVFVLLSKAFFSRHDMNLNVVNNNRIIFNTHALCYFQQNCESQYDSKPLAPVACLVYGQFGQSNMHRTFDFCPRPARNHYIREVKSLLSKIYILISLISYFSLMVATFYHQACYSKFSSSFFRFTTFFLKPDTMNNKWNTLTR